MKRLVFLMSMLMVIFGAVAEAETVYQKNYFELTLPEAWKYNASNNTYNCTTQNSMQGFNLIELEESFDGAPSIEDIAAAMKKALQLEEDYSDWEIITVDGQETALFTIHTEGVLDYYVTSIRFLGHVCYAFYYASDPVYYKTEMLALLKGLHHRTIDDMCYFRYGDAEAKYMGYTTKTVGSTKYLLVRFSWRNVGTSAEVFAVNVDVTAYQDGIELQDGFLLGINSEVGTSIMPGKEITVTRVFQLRGSTGQITLIVDKLLDFKNEWPDRTYEFQLK